MEAIYVEGTHGELIALEPDGKAIRIIPVEEENPTESNGLKWAGHEWKLVVDDGDLNLEKDGKTFLWLEERKGARANLNLMREMMFDL